MYGVETLNFKKPVSLSLCFLYLLTAVSFAGGCDNKPVSSNQTTNSTVTTQPVTTIKKPTIPARLPKNLGTMTMGTLFYKPAQAPTVYKIKTASLTPDYIAALRCLQGLVARTSTAAIYLEAGENDTFWSSYTASEYGLVFEDITPVKAFQKYRDKLKTIVTYNEKNDYEYAIAQTYASVNDGIPMTQNVYTILKTYLADITNIYDISKQFKNKKEANLWAVNNLLNHCEKNYIGIESRETEYNDYLYAVKAMTLSLDIKNADDVNTLKTIFKSNYTMPAVVFSSNNAFDDLCSEAGFSFINNDSLSNSTFFASTPNSNGFTQAESVDRKAVPGKIYASFCITDSNKLTSNQTALRNILKTPVRGSTPIGIEINPSLYEIAPPIINWFYTNTGTSSVYISGSCGYSGINPSVFPAFAAEGWKATNNFFLTKTAISVSVLQKKPAYNDKFLKFLDDNVISGYIDSCSNDGPKYFSKTPFVCSSVLTDIKNKKDYTITSKPESPTFLCFYISADELGASPFETLDNLVKQYQAANPGLIEFLLPTDLLKTLKSYEENKPITIAASTSTQPATTTTKKTKKK